MSASIVPLEARELSVARGAKTVLRRVSAEFIRPQWTAIVGPNGAGKSTLLAALAGLLPASSGTVRLDGRPIEEWAHPDRAERLTWFGQAGAVEGDIAAREIVRLGRLPRFGLFGSPSIGDENAVRAAMEETDADQFSHRRIGELSAGERQRVLLARAFASNAPLTLFDEPTVHLDAPHQRRLIHSFTARTCAGAIVISVLHDLSLALAADRMIVMKDGRIRADGHPESEAVRTTLASVFDHAISIQRLGGDGRPRWAAVPSL